MTRKKTFGEKVKPPVKSWSLRNDAGRVVARACLNNKTARFWVWFLGSEFVKPDIGGLAAPYEVADIPQARRVARFYDNAPQALIDDWDDRRDGSLDEQAWLDKVVNSQNAGG